MASCQADVASDSYADFIDRHSNLTLEELMEMYDNPCIDYVDNEYDIVYVPLEEMEPITIQKYSYTTIPKLYTVLDTSSMEASGIITTINQPALNLRGEGTIIGLIDTGIDYMNPLFQNADGSTRILGIWDQTLPESGSGIQPGIPGSLPTGRFLYGQEFTQAQINNALESDDPLSLVPSTDPTGHGTFMAGIAAGGISPTEDFTGAAPACSIGIVKLKPAKSYLRDFYQIREDAQAYQENDIMMGIKYLMLLANRYQMPLTIYIGLGTNSGSHNGTSPLGMMMRSLSRSVGLAVVLPAGNEAGLRHHYQGNMLQNQEYEDVEFRAASGERGFIIELWATDAELYTIGFVSPTGEVIQRIPLALGDESRITFALEETEITVNYRTAEIGSGSQFIFMRFVRPTPGIWRIRVYNSLFISGVYHMWLPVQGFIFPETVFLRANPDTTVTEPANAVYPLTVSTYNHLNNSIYIHSSRGYNRSGQIKPDLAAPGVNVYGPGTSSHSMNAFPMTRRTGSSVAAAHVAGAVADLLSWGIVRGNNPAMSDASIKSYLIRGANRNPAYSYPNREWGFGSLDLYQTFLSLRE